uniref:Uncharacterized protein n=1 Tax=Globisporangium ultimum (strain ATCC 200006 / CBS 805.95 / DAOM BR144) TaxID=431595 RepID=K3W6H0_GLOUD
EIDRAARTAGAAAGCYPSVITLARASRNSEYTSCVSMKNGSRPPAEPCCLSSSSFVLSSSSSSFR